MEANLSIICSVSIEIVNSFSIDKLQENKDALDQSFISFNKTISRKIESIFKLHVISTFTINSTLSTVYLWTKKFNKGQFEPLKIPGRSNSSTTPNNIRKIKRYLSENKSVRQISRIIKLPRSSVRRIAKKNLNLKCYRLVWCPNLNEKQMRINRKSKLKGEKS